MMNEESNGVLIVHETPSLNNNLQRSFPSLWKIVHGIHSMLGGFFLIVASCMYFSKVIQHFSMAFIVGGWCFTFGSFFLLLADLQQWWHDRKGCCSTKTDRDDYELPEKNRSSYSQSLEVRRLKKAENGIHSFITACGSACYVVGSALLIPFFEKYAIIGNWLIMIGSVIIFLSANWKIYRDGQRNQTNLYNHHFHFSNLINDLSSLCINICVGFGGVFYFLGVFFAPSDYNANIFRTDLSATFCVTGGSFFFLASIFLLYRYFCSPR